MSVVSVNPDSTSANTGTRTGGASVEGVLADSDDATLMAYASGESSTVTFADPSIPAGAVVKGYSYVVRGYCAGTTKIGTLSGFDSTYRAQIVANTSVAQWQARYDVDTDGAETTDIGLTVINGGAAGSSLIITKLRCDVICVAKPVPDVVYPTGTLTDDNSPIVWWMNTLDADGGPQTFWWARIFDAATYGGGGFNPETSTPVAESAGFDAKGTWQPEEMLPNGSYRAYVKIGQRVNGSGHLSDWVYEAFTVNVPSPAVPGVDLTPEPSSGRVRLDLTASTGAVTTTAFEVEVKRDGEWVRLRTVEGDGRLTGTSETAYDFEAPSDVETTYRVRSVHAFDADSESYSAWVEASTTLALTQWWITHPSEPGLNIGCDLRSFQSFDRAGRSAILQPLGATLPVALPDTRASETGTIVVRCGDDATLTALQALGSAQAPVLLRAPVSHHERDRWVLLGDESVERLVDNAFIDERNVSWAWTEVATPGVDLAYWGAVLPSEGLYPAPDLYPHG